jgi:antirestriction protein
LAQEIKIWVGNLGKYNEGILMGDWFTLPVPFSEVAARIGLDEEYEEYGIFDYEAPFKISEYDSIDHLNEVAEQMEGVYDYLWENAETLIGNLYDSVDEMIENPDKVYYLNGITNESDLGWYVIDEGLWGTDIPDSLKNYLDMEAIGRDWAKGEESVFGSTGYFGIS